MRRPTPATLADATEDVVDEADRLIRDTRRVLRDAERMQRFTVDLGGELHRLDARVREAAATRARDRAATAVLAAERVYPIAVEVLEGYPHPGLIRIGVRLVLVGLLAMLRRRG